MVESARTKGLGAFLSELDVVGHDGGSDDVVSGESEEFGHPTAATAQLEQSGAGWQSEILERLEQASEVMGILGPGGWTPKGFAAVGVEVGLFGGTGHGVVEIDFGLVGS